MLLTPANLVQRAPVVRRALLAWFQRHQRELPWRKSPSAYATVVSEFMCQQTQIATVLPYYERWMKRWPSFKALAKAQEAEVLALWAGLGYYSRAINLWRLAQGVTAAPEMPATAEGWQAFRGIGPYTAAAIASIAFGESVAVVDGNVIRVVTRLLGDRQQFRDGSQAMTVLQPLVNQLIDPKKPGDFNQAMMELGALVCRKADPLCEQCPWANFCQARAQGLTSQIPRFTPKSRQQQTVDRALVMQSGQLLLRRYGASARRLKGILELPTLASLKVKAGKQPAMIAKRTIGTVTYTESLWLVKAEATLRRTIKADDELCWIAVDELKNQALSGPHRQWLERWLNQNDQPKHGKRP